MESVWIVTTSSLPWKTGTSINPLLRAAYLGRHVEKVHLLLPWLSPQDQEHLFPTNLRFSTPTEQTEYLLDWLRQEAEFHDKKLPLLSFYRAVFFPERYSIFPIEKDMPSLVPRDTDLVILEEPEHLHWCYAPKTCWTTRFRWVVGVIHTHYAMYTEDEPFLHRFLLPPYNQLLCHAYCHSLVCLSSAVRISHPQKWVENIHGVRETFLRIGREVPYETREGYYFIGKMVWTKGMDRMRTLLPTIPSFSLHVYGFGSDLQNIIHSTRHLPIRYHPVAMDHAQLGHYKVFVNPCVSDVLCTTTAEALAMGKFVICADHPSNDFFKAFPNCLFFSTPNEFKRHIRFTMLHHPQPLSLHHQTLLSWEAATLRLLQFVALKPKDPPSDNFPYQIHRLISNGPFGNMMRQWTGQGILCPFLND